MPNPYAGIAPKTMQRILDYARAHPDEQPLVIALHLHLSERTVNRALHNAGVRKKTVYEFPIDSPNVGQSAITE